MGLLDSFRPINWIDPQRLSQGTGGYGVGSSANAALSYMNNPLDEEDAGYTQQRILGAGNLAMMGGGDPLGYYADAASQLAQQGINTQFSGAQGAQYLTGDTASARGLDPNQQYMLVHQTDPRDTGSGNRTQVQVVYQRDPSTGQAMPVWASDGFEGKDPSSFNRAAAITMLGGMAGGALGGYYQAANAATQAGAGAAGAGTGGATTAGSLGSTLGTGSSNIGASIGANAAAAEGATIGGTGFGAATGGGTGAGLSASTGSGLTLAGGGTGASGAGLATTGGSAAASGGGLLGSIQSGWNSLPSMVQNRMITTAAGGLLGGASGGGAPAPSSDRDMAGLLGNVNMGGQFNANPQWQRRQVWQPNVQMPTTGQANDGLLRYMQPQNTAMNELGTKRWPGGK